jgi:predicted nucleic acid-binding protein
MPGRDELPGSCPGFEVDALIAAIALVKRLTRVTRNEGDFAGMPVAIVNPWSATGA